MKKFLIAAAILSAALLSSCGEDDKGDGVIYVNFPDAALRAYMLENYDADGNGRICTKEAKAVTRLDLKGGDPIEPGIYPGMGITSFIGLEALPNLEYLDCSFNQATSLNLRNSNMLEELYCRNNANRQLSVLDISGCESLRVIDCSYNRISNLDLTGMTMLRTLDCKDNPLSGLRVNSALMLEELNCYGCGLGELDLTKNELLRTLDCRNNSLARLDVTVNTKLESIDCKHNAISSLRLPETATLTWLDCSENSLISMLNVSKCPSMNYLKTTGNIDLEFVFVATGQTIETVIKDDTTEVRAMLD